MERRVFFSFHYQRDIWRVNQIRNIPNVIGTSAAGFQDSSLWDAAIKRGDAEVKKLINDGLENTSVTVVCIGATTAVRNYIKYEIEQSIQRGNGIVGIHIHNLKDQNGDTESAGANPYKLTANDYKVYNYVDHERLAKRIEEAAEDAGK